MIATVALVTGCGRFGFDDPALVGDASDVTDATDAPARLSGTYRFGENTSDNFTGITSDTRLSLCFGMNSGAASHVHVNDGGSGCPSDGPQVGVMRFELSSIPRASVVLDARLALTAHSTNIQTAPHTIHRVLESWIEGDGDDNTGNLSGATWTDRAPGAPWLTAGCGVGSCDTAMIGTFSLLGPDVQVEASLDISTVQGWIDGSIANAGFAIKATVFADTSTIWSRQGPDGTRPWLVITFE